MKLLFMGTPDFARSILETLCNSHHTVDAVVTQQDKPRGRGHVMLPPPVKECALEKGLPVFQPLSLKNGELEEVLNEYAPDAIIVAAYGKILPKYILEYPKFGCINVHASLLPEYRGAAPIQRAIIDGKKETGVTIMKMEEGLDTGDMYLASGFEITDSDDYGTVHDKLTEVGGAALLEVLDRLEIDTATAEKQDDALATYAAKIEKADTFVDFTMTARQVFNKIRAMSPAPLTSVKLGELPIKLVSAKIVSEDSSNGDTPAGTVTSLSAGIEVACGSGKIMITALTPAGKNKMSAADFIRGRKINVGDRFS